MTPLRPIRVLDLRDTYDIGGPGKTILETFRFIDAARFELHLAVFMQPGESTDTPFLNAARHYGLPVHVISGGHQYDPRLIARTAALVHALGIDIVHAHEVRSDVITWLSSARHRARIMTTMHGWIGNSARQRLLTRVDKWVARRFSRVLAVSAAIRDELIGAGVPAERVTLLHNAIVMDRYRRTGRQGAVAALVGRPVPRPVLTSLGRLSAEKGHAVFLEALSHVVQRGHRLSAVLAGDGPERPRLEALVHELGLADTVFLVGHVDQPQSILEDTDLMVLPSLTEGLPNAALEALAMEVPVLATRVGGTPEVIEDGASGRLVAPGDPSALAAAIEDFLGHRSAWTAMGARGPALVRDRFDFRSRTRRIEAIYEQLAGAGRR